MSTLLNSAEQPAASSALWGMRHKVADVDRATDFYVQQLGFRVDHQNPQKTLQHSLGGLKLTLLATQSSECVSMSDDCDWGSKYRSHIVLQVNDLASRFERLQRAGMRFAKEMEVSPLGKHVQLEDPDGNQIELFEPSTSLFPLDSRIESRRKFATEWLAPILISLTIVGLFLGAGALLLLVNK